jgi:hypothetical protein
MNSSVAHWQWAVDTAYVSVFCVLWLPDLPVTVSLDRPPRSSRAPRETVEKVRRGFGGIRGFLFLFSLVCFWFYSCWISSAGIFDFLFGVFRSVYVCFFSIFWAGKKAEGAMAHSRHNQNEENSDDYDPTPYQVDLLLRVVFLDFFWLSLLEFFF